MELLPINSPPLYIYPVHQFFNEWLTEFPSILDNFSSIQQVLTRDGRESHGSGKLKVCEAVRLPNGHR